MAVKYRGAAVYFGVLILSILLFQFLPRIDIAVSGLLWSPSGGWYLGNWAPFRIIYRGVPWISRVIVLALLAGIGADLLFERHWAGFGRKELLYLLATAIIGPGLLANTILKDHWGRARPSQIAEFGGTAHFTPALEPARECVSNCSFVSGHGAMAFSLVAFAFLVRNPRRRSWAFAAALGFGALVALTRIAQGGHFLSDNVYAALLMIAVAWVLHRWIVVADGLNRPWLYARLGHAIRPAYNAVEAAFEGSARLWWLVNLAVVLAIGLSAAFLDPPVAYYFHASEDRLTLWFQWITQFGLSLGWLLISGIGAILLYAISRSPRFGHLAARARAWAVIPAFIFASVALAGLAADGIKILVGRTRPKLLFADDSYGLTGIAWRADHWSFPSGHTVNVAALAMALSYVWPRHAAAYWLLAALVGLSRIGTTQHYVSDVIGGAWLGALVTMYLHGVLRRSGLDLRDAKAGVIPPLPGVGWGYRLLGLGGGWGGGWGGSRGTSSTLRPTPRG